jgi:hypothetical protein
LLAISSCTVLYFRRSAIVVAIPAPFQCQNFIAHDVIIITSIFSHHQQLCLFPTFRRGSGRVGNTISEVVEYESQYKYIPSQVRGAHGEKQHMFLRAFSAYRSCGVLYPGLRSPSALVCFVAMASHGPPAPTIFIGVLHTKFTMIYSWWVDPSWWLAENVFAFACFGFLVSGLPEASGGANHVTVLRSRISSQSKVSRAEKALLLLSLPTPVGVRIRDGIMVFNVLLSKGHLEPNCHFTFLNVP